MLTGRQSGMLFGLKVHTPYFSCHFQLLSIIFLLPYSTATDCTLPSNSVVNQQLRDEITSGGGDGGAATIRGGPYYVCQVQGTTMETYQELSVIMEYTYQQLFGESQRVGRFEMICQAFPDEWSRRSDSLTVLSSGPDVTYDGSIGLRTDCSSCINTAGNDNNCVACHSSCNDGLMRCTGSTSDDCCVAFEEDGMCKIDLNCTKNNFIANAQNNFACTCELPCSDGYSLNSTSCTCALTDICVADNPCNNNGSCVLGSSPDQYTCNCTGYYTGANCSACGLSCSDGYSLNITSCTCTLTDICVADNPCNNNGLCVLGSSPDQYTCNCTGTGYTGTNCTVCPECPMAGYSLYSSNCSCYPSHICLLNNPCNNGGNCTIQEGDNNYTCACTGNYGGTNCTDCSLVCQSGYVAETNCIECVLDDICVADNPCNNGGVCILDTAPDQYTCNCTGYYNGTKCSVCGLNCNSGTPSSDCSSCNCGMMYTGLYCETELDYCNGVDCSDHGTCSNDYVNMVAECNCYDGWAGPSCDECDIDNCRECVLNGQQADCGSCIEGYASSGSSCVPQEVCPCRNNGICISTQDGSYRCNCSRPWTGDNCTECVEGYGKQDNGTFTYCRNLSEGNKQSEDDVGIYLGIAGGLIIIVILISVSLIGVIVFMINKKKETANSKKAMAIYDSVILPHDTAAVPVTDNAAYNSVGHGNINTVPVTDNVAYAGISHKRVNIGPSPMAAADGNEVVYDIPTI